MALETVTEFETVEKEREVMVCDECSIKEDEIPVIPISLHAHISKEVAGETEHMSYMGNEPAIVKDMCAKCIEEQFDLELPDEGKIESLDVSSKGDITIETTVEKQAIFTGLRKWPEETIIALTAPVFLLDSTLCSTVTEDESEVSKSRLNIDHVFIAGFAGGLLYLTLAILVLYFTIV